MKIKILEGKKKRAIRFEEEIIEFLKKLNFEFPDGARDNFLIGGIQVDACAGHEKTLLVIECTMKQELGEKSLRNKIKELRGSANTWEKAFKNHPTYKRYSNYSYVIAVKNIDVRKEDIVFANNEKPRVYIWDENCIDYYKDLYSKIREYAKFNLLGEMGIRPEVHANISVPAFLATFGRIKMYSFLIDPRDLLEVSYVARREVRNERYYQRLVKKERLNKIAKYINEGNILPNNLIIAFGDGFLSKYIKFHAKTQNYIGECTSGITVSYGILEFPRDYRSCWIIDGQHRLYAFVNAKKFLTYMPVIAFENIDLQQQCKFFLDINKNQKPVPPDLVWDLNGDMIYEQEDGIISNVVKRLNEGGTLFHKIHIPSKGIKAKNLLKLAGICLSIKRVKLAKPNTISKTENPLYDQDPIKCTNKLFKELSRYFGHIASVLLEDWEKGKNGFVLHDGGNSVMIRLLEKIISRCISNGLPSDEDYIKYITPLKKLLSEQYQTKEDLKNLKLRITSEGGKDNLLKEFINYIKQEANDTLFGGQIESSLAKEIRELEGRLKELIKIILSKEGNDWFRQRVSPEVYGRALKHLEKHGETDIQKAYLQMTFGECLSLIRQCRSLFYPIFKVEYGFGSDQEVDGAFELINRIRTTQAAHEVGAKKKIHDETLFKIYLDKINKCLDSAMFK